MPMMTIDSIGVGSGTKDIPDRPNVIRAMIGEVADAESRSETVVVIEANIDDMNPELFPPLVNDLLENGARDVFLTPILAKKGRPAHLISVLVDEALVSVVADTLLNGSSTLGLRMRREERITLDREWKSVETPWSAVKVKIGSYKGSVSSTAPEYDDCERVAREAGVTTREVYEAAYAAAIKGEFIHG